MYVKFMFCALYIIPEAFYMSSLYAIKMYFVKLAKNLYKLKAESKNYRIRIYVLNYMTLLAGHFVCIYTDS